MVGADKLEWVVYADNAATTHLSSQALEAMMPYLTNEFGNPGGLYRLGREARVAVDDSRESIARAIGAVRQEITFTSCGTESDNMAILGAVALEPSRRHIVTTPVEHEAVLKPIAHLAATGYEVTYLSVDRQGHIDLDELEAILRPDTALVSIMLANNEIGTIYPIGQVVRLAHRVGALVHTDAVQAMAHMPVDVHGLGVDLLSASAHKFHGPRGMGFLYRRSGLKLPPLLMGGGQEAGRRAGTENVAGIVGMATALTEDIEAYAKTRAHVFALSRRLADALVGSIPNANLTGDPTDRLPGTVSLVFEGVEGEVLVLLLDRCGISVSAGSACAAGGVEPSHVLLACGFSREQAAGALRISLAEDVSDRDVDYLIEQIPQAVARIRSSVISDFGEVV